MTEMTKQYEMTAEVGFTIAPGVDPLYWINDDGVKVWRMDGIYPHLTTEEQLWDHLAYNAICNGVQDARHIDGFADLPTGALTMRVKNLTVEAN